MYVNPSPEKCAGSQCARTGSAGCSRNHRPWRAQTVRQVVAVHIQRRNSETENLLAGQRRDQLGIRPGIGGGQGRPASTPPVGIASSRKVGGPLTNICGAVGGRRNAWPFFQYSSWMGSCGFDVARPSCTVEKGPHTSGSSARCRSSAVGSLAQQRVHLQVAGAWSFAGELALGLGDRIADHLLGGADDRLGGRGVGTPPDREVRTLL